MRNLFVIEKHLVIIYHEHKHQKNTGFDPKDPVVLVPHPLVGKLFFVYLVYIVRTTLSLSFTKLSDEDDAAVKRIAEKIIAYEWQHPFTVLSHNVDG